MRTTSAVCTRSVTDRRAVRPNTVCVLAGRQRKGELTICGRCGRVDPSSSPRVVPAALGSPGALVGGVGTLASWLLACRRAKNWDCGLRCVDHAQLMATTIALSVSDHTYYHNHDDESPGTGAARPLRAPTAVPRAEPESRTAGRTREWLPTLLFSHTRATQASGPLLRVALR